MILTLISSESRYPVSRSKIKAKIEEILKHHKVNGVEVSVLVVGERKIRQLNKQFRQTDEPTDVLSFPLEEPRDKKGILRLGDIVISYPHAQRYAREENKMVDEVILELAEHGLLHLLGFNHQEGLNFNGNFSFKHAQIANLKI